MKMYEGVYVMCIPSAPNTSAEFCALPALSDFHFWNWLNFAAPWRVLDSRCPTWLTLCHNGLGCSVKSAESPGRPDPNSGINRCHNSPVPC